MLETGRHKSPAIAATTTGSTPATSISTTARETVGAVTSTIRLRLVSLQAQLSVQRPRRWDRPITMFLRAVRPTRPADTPTTHAAVLIISRSTKEIRLSTRRSLRRRIRSGSAHAGYETWLAWNANPTLAATATDFKFKSGCRRQGNPHSQPKSEE